jgi:hypothetical protein
MKWGDLRSAFRGVAWKRLTPHEVDPSVSNGHEFQGVNLFRAVLGTERKRFDAVYMLLRDETDDIETIESWANWYDSREDDADRSAEWRLYYPSEGGQIQSRLSPGDLMVIAALADGRLALLFAREGSSREEQLRILFDLELRKGEKGVNAFADRLDLGFAAASIAEELGFGKLESPEGTDSRIVSALVEELTADHPESLPAGRVISALVRSRIGDAGVMDDPDAALTRWVEVEAAVFRAWEDGLIERRIRSGFDVQSFRDFSMSIRQSRVSRAGGALEDHFADILRTHRIRFVAQPRIDGGERPDFLFPGLREYEDENFPDEKLRMLGAKFTAKDRWRQVLNEARRIKRKHLLTLEPSVSIHQLRLMREQTLQLVIPTPIQNVYPETSRGELMSVANFINELRPLQ